MGSFLVKIVLFLLMFGLITSTAVEGRRPMHMKNNNGEEDHEQSSKNGTYKHGNQDGTVINEEDHGHSSKTSTYNDFDKDDTEVRGINDPMVSHLPNQACYTQFFVGGATPTGLRNGQNLRYICQAYNEGDQQAQYGTMFDRNRGIAVYSAYILRPADVDFQGSHQWRRTHEHDVPLQGSQQIYQGQPYDKGHLVPGETYSSTPVRFRSTFVYTNAVPQRPAFNRGLWAQYERRIRRYAIQCTQGGGELYLITGTAFGHITNQNAVGYNPHVNINTMGPVVGNAINVPNSMWTAGCCINMLPDDVESFAVIGNNLPNDLAHPNEPLTRKITVARLETFLANDVDNHNHNINGPIVSLFPAENGACSNPHNDLPALP